MNENKIYVKGTAGFNSAVKAKLENDPKYKVRNINADNIMVLIPAGSQLKDLVTSIGEDLVTAHSLQFLTSMDTHDSLALSKTQRFATPVKMSRWTREHSNVRAREIHMPQHNPGVVVF